MVWMLVTMATGILSVITIAIKTSIKIHFDYFAKQLEGHGWLQYTVRYFLTYNMQLALKYILIIFII